ncbi:MAG TPA: site-specific DNA-methyltransferase [Clostridiales bacterium]|nr:site-specific DNA-methyltransferase [Clostridiales bacterium]
MIDRITEKPFRQARISGSTLVNADCFDVFPFIEDKSIDAIICDLPYGTTACKWDSIIPFEPLWEQYERIIKDNGAIVLTASQPFTTKLINSNIKIFRYELIWKKERPTNPLMCKKQFPKYHENICVFYKKQPTFNPQYIKRKEKNKRNNKPRNFADNTKVITDKYSEMVLSGNNDYIYQPSIIEVPMERGLHPTQKPVKLLELLIKTYTNEGETVLDNCAGSFTTAVACDNTNRNWICIEKEEDYCNIGLTRINDNRERLGLPLLKSYNSRGDLIGEDD